jgi:DNA anti-recombination protein RmuC
MEKKQTWEIIDKIISLKKETRVLEEELANIRKKCQHTWRDYNQAASLELGFGMREKFCEKCGIMSRRLW